MTADSLIAIVRCASLMREVKPHAGFAKQIGLAAALEWHQYADRLDAGLEDF